MSCSDAGSSMFHRRHRQRATSGDVGSPLSEALRPAAYTLSPNRRPRAGPFIRHSPSQHERRSTMPRAFVRSTATRSSRTRTTATFPPQTRQGACGDVICRLYARLSGRVSVQSSRKLLPRSSRGVAGRAKRELGAAQSLARQVAVPARPVPLARRQRWWYVLRRTGIRRAHLSTDCSPPRLRRLDPASRDHCRAPTGGHSQPEPTDRHRGNT